MRLPCFATRLAPALVLASTLLSPAPARAAECRELGGIGVAVGGLVSLGVVTITSLVAPAVAASEDESLTYGGGVAVGFLSGLVGAGIGMAVSSSAACETGPWLPGVVGGGTSLAGVTTWAVVASDPGTGAASSGPASQAASTPPFEVHAPLITLRF